MCHWTSCYFSGIPQGKLIRRQRLPKNDATGEHYTYKDIKINDTVTFYGKVFHVTDCDVWTRVRFLSWLQFLLVYCSLVCRNICWAKDWLSTTLWKFPLTRMRRTESEETLRKHSLPNRTLTNSTSSWHWTERFIIQMYSPNIFGLIIIICGQVLRFFCIWDDRESMFGEARPFIVHYYLVDDTVEIREVHRNNDGRDPFPCLLNRMRLPKNLYDVPR